MAEQNRTTLKALFEQGDVPSGANYADVIDSFHNISEQGKIVISPIGTWNMDANASVSLTISGVSTTNIRSILSVFIFDDAGTNARQLDWANPTGDAPEGDYFIASTTVNLRRRSGGLFDSTSYDGTQNRGYVIALVAV